MLGKNTILKAIHNLLNIDDDNVWVWMLGKNTILKAIHNGGELGQEILVGVNAG